MGMSIQKSGKYPAPRDNPLDYPGIRPSSSFILVGDMIHSIRFDDKEKGDTEAGVADSGNDEIPIDYFLKNRGVAPLSERFPVIGYGSNPVPGQLVSKFGNEAIVPVVFGNMRDTDIVYNLISNQGYAFAELLPNQKNVNSDIAITYLDKKQLKRMIETEQNYVLAFSPSTVRLDSDEVLNDSFVFAGFRNIWVPSSIGKPIAIKELPAENRQLPELTQYEALDLVIRQYNLDYKNPIELALHIRGQTDMGERLGKLKYELQHEIATDNNSIQSLASLVKHVPTNFI